MDHRTDEQLQSFLDHEDSAVERAAVERHVKACARCHGRLEALEALVADVRGAVGLLRPPPVRMPAFAALEARAFAGDAGGPTADASNRGRSSVMIAASWLRAAVVVLAVAGVAGAATIVAQRRALDRAQQTGAAQSERAEPAVADTQMARSGVSVMPNAGRIVVAVRGAAPGTTIDVGIAESIAASTFVRGDGEGVRFSAQTGRIDVDVTGLAIALDVRLPARAANATVEVDGRIRARKVDGIVRIERGSGAVTVRAARR